MQFRALDLYDPNDLDRYLNKTVILLFGDVLADDRFTFEDLQSMGANDLSNRRVAVRQVALPSQKISDPLFGEKQHEIDYRVYLSDKPFDYLEHRVKNMKGAINKWFYKKTGTNVKVIVLA